MRDAAPQKDRAEEDSEAGLYPLIEEPLLRSDRAALNHAKETFTSEVHNNYAEQRAQERHERDYQSLIDQVRGDADRTLFPDKMMRAYIDAEAQTDVGLHTAWLNREANPRQWAAVAEKLAKGFGKYAVRTPDPNLTEDTAAVAALARGASSTKAPQEPQADYSRMSNAEYRNEIKNKYGFDPGI